jgi:hypothetical protein
MFTAKSLANAIGINSFGKVVTSSASATATSSISEEDALNKATEIAQNVADSQLQTDINIIDQSVETSVSIVGESGATGPTDEQGLQGIQ